MTCWQSSFTHFFCFFLSTLSNLEKKIMPLVRFLFFFSIFWIFKSYWFWNASDIFIWRSRFLMFEVRHIFQSWFRSCLLWCNFLSFCELNIYIYIKGWGLNASSWRTNFFCFMARVERSAIIYLRTLCLLWSNILPLGSRTIAVRKENTSTVIRFKCLDQFTALTSNVRRSLDWANHFRLLKNLEYL